ncbi:unnamed protein product [Lactuca saligna]|uniref:Uncharacterized protein n=1 Tax=Lactuca saligna TaxID=75948 RepID=A0AA35ZEQ5_LACSI|nr:unnamed protein product [Lactuca saligna]
MFASVPPTPRKDLNIHKVLPKVEKKRENLSVSYANVARGSHSDKPFSDKEDSIIVLDSGNFVIDNKNVDAFDRFEQDGSNASLADKEDASLDPFGIYDVMEKLDNEEKLNKTSKLHKFSSQEHSRNSASKIEKSNLPSSPRVVVSVSVPIVEPFPDIFDRVQ